MPELPDLPGVVSIDIRGLFFQGGFALLAFVVVCSTLSALVANYARRKGRTWGSFYFIGLASIVLSGIIVATMTPATHADELVVCPSCGEGIRSVAHVCPNCGQNLTPNASIGEDVVGRALIINSRLRIAGLIVGAIGLILVLVSMFQGDGDLAKNLQASIGSWGILGSGIAMLVMIPVRTRMIEELADKLTHGNQ
jgi:ribosomal protein L32